MSDLVSEVARGLKVRSWKKRDMEVGVGLPQIADTEKTTNVGSFKGPRRVI
jgi:hypothetical protein